MAPFSPSLPLLPLVVMVGDVYVGKSNLLLRFTDNKFQHNLAYTTGVNEVTKRIEVDSSTVINAHIWDTGMYMYSIQSYSMHYYSFLVDRIHFFPLLMRLSWDQMAS